MKRDPFAVTIQRGATTVLTAMENGDHRKYAVAERLVGEPVHAVLIAATNECPALMRALLRLAKKHFPPKIQAPAGQSREGSPAPTGEGDGK